MVKTEYGIERYNRALEIVQRNLQPERWRLLDYGSWSLIRCEKKAMEIIEFAKKNIRGHPSEIISLVDCIHGKIRFDRKIRFLDWEKSQEDDLVNSLKQTNYISEEGRSEMRRRAENDPAFLWKKHLTFFDA